MLTAETRDMDLTFQPTYYIVVLITQSFKYLKDALLQRLWFNFFFTNEEL